VWSIWDEVNVFAGPAIDLKEFLQVDPKKQYHKIYRRVLEIDELLTVCLLVHNVLFYNPGLELLGHFSFCALKPTISATPLPLKKKGRMNGSYCNWPPFTLLVLKENEAILKTRSDAKGKRDNKKLSESCVQLEPNGILGIKSEYLTSYCHLSWRIRSLEANNSGNVVILKLLSRSCCCCSFKIFNLNKGEWGSWACAVFDLKRLRLPVKSFALNCP